MLPRWFPQRRPASVFSPKALSAAHRLLRLAASSPLVCLIVRYGKHKNERTVPSMGELIKVRSMIRRLKKQEIVSKAKTDKLKETLRKDLHRLVIETEGLIALVLRKPRSKGLVRPDETVLRR